MSSLPDFKDAQSSNIAGTAHDGDTLYVKFHGGAVWRYHHVDAALYQQMLGAESMGKFFNANIRKIKPGQKVDVPPVSAAAQ